jgi:chromosome segregation ATPase
MTNKKDTVPILRQRVANLIQQNQNLDRCLTEERTIRYKLANDLSDTKASKADVERKLAEANQQIDLVRRERDEAIAALVTLPDRGKMSDGELGALLTLACAAPELQMAMTMMGPMYRERDQPARQELQRRALQALDIELTRRGVLPPKVVTKLPIGT